MTSTISIPIASPSDDQKFLDPLPNEIIQTIVSYLTRSDCMQYMRVCRSWYDTVPQYFKEHWSSLKLLRHDVYSSNNLWLRCIDGGSHIKQVAFEWFHKQHEIDRIMKLLFVKDCQNIEALGIRVSLLFVFFPTLHLSQKTHILCITYI
ncbi:hypothetical protein BDA99DRAFT_40769 [Phascolomyces articulosus]|uniref:F-box domain-containing protein n=1 Tax=Phascolomyces articulosus TaxID=60185 RepID=A0AAD5KBJ7_9FUNG|nr:hypothetical protein BDA99DRAFT_40769 [Phascolomyces articulosus]